MNSLKPYTANYYNRILKMLNGNLKQQYKVIFTYYNLCNSFHLPKAILLLNSVKNCYYLFFLYIELCHYYVFWKYL